MSRTQAGVASSLIALTPVLILPVAWARGERIGVNGLVGTVAAVAGVTLLFA